MMVFNPCYHRKEISFSEFCKVLKDYLRDHDTVIC